MSLTLQLAPTLSRRPWSPMTAAFSEETRCQYPSKRCDNMRSLKISGDLHRFCLFHRCRANDAQRRWTKRKMEEGDAPTPARRRRTTAASDPKTTTQRRHSSRTSARADLPTDLHAPSSVHATQQLPFIVPCGEPQGLGAHDATTLDWLTDDLFQLIDKSVGEMDVPQLSGRPVHLTHDLLASGVAQQRPGVVL